jgi:catechol 2,3-dioxygenase-like lactoylglutathione lyase family enzyme
VKILGVADPPRGGKARLVGINHVALEVGDIDDALDFYGRLLEFELRGRIGRRMAFLDAGDQFIALSAPRRQAADESRHFGLVVDDVGAVRDALDREGVEILPGRGLDFLDPWGNRIQVVQYGEVQFAKTTPALRRLGLEGLGKTAEAEAEMKEKGLLP